LVTQGAAPDRIVIMGGSYGGYMAMNAMGRQPALWAAGVSIMGISSLRTYLEGTAGYLRAVRETEYGALQEDYGFLDDASPIKYADRIRSPLLMFHGANDPRVPAGESVQMHRAIRAQGGTSEMAVFPDEGHGLSRRSNRASVHRHVLSFLRSALDRQTRDEK
jgi:dipeptidyl aminopeptidase/acylaminoacyl peptidase